MKKINKIKSNLFSRQLSMAKIAFKSGKDFYFSKDEDLKARLKDGFEKHAQFITSELGIMKGSFMKAGQMLSVYGASFLSPKAQEILQSLQNQTSYLDWKEISKQIPSHWKEELEISPTPLAAASLGQVHKAVDKDGNLLAIKIQYKGVKKAIKNDIKALRFLLKSLSLLPTELDTKDLFSEIQTMLEAETDYLREAQLTKDFNQKLNHYPEYHITKVIDQYSNDNIMTTQFIEGTPLNEIDKLNLTQEDKNKLGISFFKLLFIELFELEQLQTDVHLGNYLIMNSPEKGYHWGLIDFGASKIPPKSFIHPYQGMIKALIQQDKKKFLDIMFQMNYLSHKQKTNTDLLWKYAKLMGEPFLHESYHWGNSSLSDDILKLLPSVIKEISIGKPPKHAVFIDRKIAGVYFVLKKLEAKFDVNEVVRPFIHTRSAFNKQTEV
ncbi:MAG: AarF/ABC1/UbiB kinase family protein [Bacteriovoracaceae bacterium]|jgi:predicted unusual protein kinase regulating ubiquinone biosynthesis (AarF/ABC1/UbiB family)|nr:hypothetical protein [Halobacteriovoraceae bacterium]MDP7320531.1 AarF/ABC1/UbiB kinase family protein [Bacteriovoracaceae bacterium]